LRLATAGSGELALQDDGRLGPKLGTCPAGGYVVRSSLTHDGRMYRYIKLQVHNIIY
jgi:hypothetical protein